MEVPGRTSVISSGRCCAGETAVRHPAAAPTPEHRHPSDLHHITSPVYCLSNFKPSDLPVSESTHWGLCRSRGGVCPRSSGQQFGSIHCSCWLPSADRLRYDVQVSVSQPQGFGAWKVLSKKSVLKLPTEGYLSPGHPETLVAMFGPASVPLS